MRTPGYFLLLAAASLGCTPEHGTWRRDAPLTLTAMPVVLRPPYALNPGRVHAALCLGLGAALWGPPAPDQTARPVAGVGFALGTHDTLRVRATLRTATGQVWAAPHLGFLGPWQRPDAACFEGLPPRELHVDGEPPRFVTVELSASHPLSITYISWTAAAFGSL